VSAWQGRERERASERGRGSGAAAAAGRAPRALERNCARRPAHPFVSDSRTLPYRPTRRRAHARGRPLTLPFLPPPALLPPARPSPPPPWPLRIRSPCSTDRLRGVRLVGEPRGAPPLRWLRHGLPHLLRLTHAHRSARRGLVLRYVLREVARRRAYPAPVAARATGALAGREHERAALRRLGFAAGAPRSAPARSAARPITAARGAPAASAAAHQSY
jgi:hypothetical protein